MVDGRSSSRSIEPDPLDRDKLRPAAGLAQPLALVMQRSDRFKFMSANCFKQLRENRITMRHGLDSLVFQRVVEKLIVNQQRISRTFFSGFVGQQ
ncbi:hypothetical protein SAMN05216315_10542 [Nitrosospira sp. Nsp18]|nr:hypothetical protein SAMN05216315_10542 [Nitrosospira sp. Nsp18]